jgi:D-erythro-7,8-dihydroneopterin triphosphate epimerase
MEYDRLFIKDLLLRAIIGINPEEREKKQDVIVNLVLHADLSRSSRSDDIEDTVDYKSIKTAVIELVENSDFYLVEKMAQQIADTCLKDPRVVRVDVRVEKPGALRFAKSVGIEITRHQ